jgi:uncharacterized protein (DUF433 family)
MTIKRRTIDRHIAVTPGVAGGKPRIAGHRITVEDVVVLHERFGRSPDEIAAEHGLTLADVHAALAYYFDHRVEVDRSIGRGESRARKLRARRRSKLPSHLNGEAG